MTIVVDMSIFLLGWLIAQILFSGYEAHVPLGKRIGKFAVLFVIFLAIDYFVGRWLFYGLLLVMTVAIAILHGYWFHYRHGIHWRTAEPRAEYLELIGEEGEVFPTSNGTN